MSSIVLGLRQGGDDYPERGWLLVGTFAPKREKHQNRELRALDTLHCNHPSAPDGPEADFWPAFAEPRRREARFP